MPNKKIVYVVGAGLSAGLNFPTVSNLLPEIWPRLAADKIDEPLAKIIRFHHPSFNAALQHTYPNIEELLSEIETNEKLFTSSRPAIGNFSSDELTKCREILLLEIARWFHELKKSALLKPPVWLSRLVTNIRKERAEVISFNWDLILDELLFGDALTTASYGFGRKKAGPVLLKPHGSLNWYRGHTGKFLSESKTLRLFGSGKHEILAFKPFREPFSKKRSYMPLIIPPVYNKQFHDALFRKLWQQVVSALSTASEVRFIGYSLPQADFHARFIMRCGFYNQVEGEIAADGSRNAPTGRAHVLIVDPSQQSKERLEAAVGWRCMWHDLKVEDWMAKYK